MGRFAGAGPKRDGCSPGGEGSGDPHPAPRRLPLNFVPRHGRERSEYRYSPCSLDFQVQLRLSLFFVYKRAKVTARAHAVMLPRVTPAL